VPVRARRFEGEVVAGGVYVRLKMPVPNKQERQKYIVQPSLDDMRGKCAQLELVHFVTGAVSLQENRLVRNIEVSSSD
jgi:hypothetical protein